jgi:hypothetical protein
VKSTVLDPDHVGSFVFGTLQYDHILICDIIVLKFKKFKNNILKMIRCLRNFIDSIHNSLYIICSTYFEGCMQAIFDNCRKRAVLIMKDLEIFITGIGEKSGKTISMCQLHAMK